MSSEGAIVSLLPEVALDLRCHQFSRDRRLMGEPLRVQASMTDASESSSAQLESCAAEIRLYWFRTMQTSCVHGVLC